MNGAPRRQLLLVALATILGVVGGAAAWTLVRLIAITTNLALLGRFDTSLPSFSHHPPGPIVIPVAAAGGLLVALLARWSPVIRGHGIPEAMEAVLERQSRITPRAAIAKPLSAAIAIGTGGPFGAEGPIIVTGGALGSLIGQVLPVTPSERKILLASGAAAGMAATFGAPIAAVVLAIELLLFEFSARALVPLAVASSVAGGMHALLFGRGPLFHVPPHAYAGVSLLPVFAALGVLCGLLAVVICRGLSAVERGYERLPISSFWHPVLGGIAFGIVGVGVPRALGVGYGVIDDVLGDRLTVSALALVLAAKLVAWWFALGSGTSGGTLAPLLLIAASFGALLGHVAHSADSHFPVSPGALALVAMAATFGAATRATFTAIVFTFELTRDYDVIVPLMLAAVVAHLVAAALLDHGLMTEKLARRGLDVPLGYEPDRLAATRARQVMSTPVASLPAHATVADARLAFERGEHGAYPLTDDAGRLVGIVTRGDVLRSRDDRAASTPVGDVASSDVVTAGGDTSLLDVVQTMLEESVDHVPVTDPDGRLIGIVTRADLLRVHGRRLAEERPQRGWLQRSFARPVDRARREP